MFIIISCSEQVNSNTRKKLFVPKTLKNTYSLEIPFTVWALIFCQIKILFETLIWYFYTFMVLLNISSDLQSCIFKLRFRINSHTKKNVIYPPPRDKIDIWSPLVKHFLLESEDKFWVETTIDNILEDFEN